MRKTMMAVALGAVLLMLAAARGEASTAIGEGVQIGPIIGTPSVDGDLIAYRVSEALDGIDLNGDGDTSDYVIHVVSAGEAEPTNLGIAGDIDNMGSGLIAMAIRESSERDDLNGDGDQSDVVLFIYDAATGQLTNSGLPIYQDYYSYTPDVNIEHGNLYFSVPERSAGSDLNADGDSTDNVATYRGLPVWIVGHVPYCRRRLIYSRQGEAWQTY